jgi:segregation and condensation protein B
MGIIEMGSKKKSKNKATQNDSRVVESQDEERSIIRVSELSVLAHEEAAAESVPESEILEAIEPEASEAQAPGDEALEPVTVADETAHHPETNAEAVATNKITDRTQIEQVLEAIIFAAPKAISLVRLRNLLNSFDYETDNLVGILQDMIERSSQRGFQLVKVAGGYQFRTHPEHAAVLQKLLEDKPARLSGSALEVLAIIAYKQPLSRSEIDSVRGVDSGHLLKGLLEKNLVRTVGHSENAGRALLYGTTPYFLEVFSLGSLDDLPAIEEFQRELKPHSGDGNDTLVLAPEPGLMPDSSDLAANPDRGTFDEISDEPVEAADFGLEERAREEEQETQREPEATA